MVQTKDAKLPLLLPVMILAAFIVALHLGSALSGRPLIRALHVGPALEYARGSINLLRPVVRGFNANGTPTAQELPVWQAAAALAFKATGSTWYGWGNVVSLLLFGTGLWPFFQLARQYIGTRAAWWSTAFFLAQPLIIAQAGSASTDGLSLVVTLWFLFCADKLIRTGLALWWLPTAMFAALSAVIKLPFFMAAGLCSVFILLTLGVRSARSWLFLAGAGAFAAISFGLWTSYTDSLAAQAQYPYMELRLSHNPWMVDWYFGSLGYRLAPGNWIKGGWRFLHATLGSLPLAVLLVLALLRPGNRLPKLWLASTFLTTLVFTHLVLEHWHYYLMCCPPVAMLCGVTLARAEDFGAQELPNRWLRIAVVTVVLLFSATDGLIATKIAAGYDSFPQEVSLILRQYTKPQDKLLVWGEPTWGSEVLLRSERNGLSVFALQDSPRRPTVKGLYTLLTNSADLNRLKSLGFNKLVLLSESPVQYAITGVNPGSKAKRMYYPATLPGAAEAWPVVYRSEDLLIKEIP
jgi:hypothetical protein